MPGREHVYRSIVKTFAERRMIWAERSPRKTAFTVRMWRARLLTFTAVAAAIADRAVGLMGGREDLRLSVRLAFERLFRGLNALPGDCDAWKRKFEPADGAGQAKVDRNVAMGIRLFLGQLH